MEKKRLYELAGISEEYALSRTPIRTQGQLDWLKNSVEQIVEDNDVVAFKVPRDMYYALFDIAQDYVSGRIKRVK